MQRADGVGHHAADFALLGVDGQLGLDMLDVEESDPLGLTGRPGLGKRRRAWGPRPRRRILSPGGRAQEAGARIEPKPRLRIGLDMVVPDRRYGAH